MRCAISCDLLPLYVTNFNQTSTLGKLHLILFLCPIRPASLVLERTLVVFFIFPIIQKW